MSRRLADLNEYVTHIIREVPELEVKKEVLVWNLPVFLSLSLSSPSFPLFPSLPRVPSQIQLEGLGGRCELPQLVWAEPGRQTASGVF